MKSSSLPELADDSRTVPPFSSLTEGSQALAALLGSLPGMVYLCRGTDYGKMQFVSEGSSSLTGYRPAALTGDSEISYAELIHADDRAEVNRATQSAARSHAPYRVCYRIKTATGVERWVLDQGRMIQTGTTAGEVLAGFVTDTSESKQTEDKLHQWTNLLELQPVISTTANESVSDEEAIQSALNLVCAYTGWPVGHVYQVAGRPLQELRPGNIWHIQEPGRFGAFQEATRHCRFEADQGLVGRALAQGRLQWTNNPPQDLVPERAAAAQQDGLVFAITLPVWAGQEVVAVLEFFSDKPVTISDRWQQVLNYVGTQLGRVIERQRAQQTVQQRERYFRALLENISDNITIMDAKGTVLYESPSVARLQGYTPEELVGRNGFEMIHPDDVPRVMAIFQGGLARPGCTETTEYRVRHKDGSWRACEVVGKNMLHDEAVRGIVLSTRDVTERKAAEQALRDSEEQFRNLFENSPDAIFVEDAGGNVLDVNPAACRLHGLAREELIGRNVRDLVPPDRREIAAQMMREWFEGGRIDFQGISIGPDGRRVPVEIRGSATVFRGEPAVLLQVRDVSEREATEENLRLQSAALKSTANAIVITDASGRIVWVNPAFTTLTGYTAEEAAGQNPRVLKSGRQPPEFYDAMWRTVLAGEVWRGELINRRKDGSLYTEDMTITPVRDEAGQITHFIAVKQDATERNRMSEELRNSNLRLRQALDELQRTQQRVIQQERLGALGQMASGIAHDFNNTLMPILGYSELLLHVSANLDDPQKVRRYLGVIRTCAEDASRIVSRLREFHRPREATEAFTHVDLNRLVAEALTLTQPKWKNQTEAAGIAIRVLQDLGSVPQCDGNASDLREVLTNLIFNAVDAMPQGGTLTLRTRAENAHLIVEVSDTGVGMSKSVRQHCFEPFYSTKGEHGTGLGLAMVYGIVQRHDGTIDIQTELNRGTTFRIRLPLAHSRPESSAAPSASNTVRALRVLFADDEPNVRDILVEFMTADGHAVTAVSNGEDALTQLRDGQFDLAIVDRAMPSMSGDQLAAAMKSIRPHVPIIMLTGFGGLMHAAHEQPAAVDFVVSKPITLQQLREALATAAASSQARQ